MKKRLSILFSLLLFFYSSLHAQCDPNLIPANSSPSTAYKQRNGRCEGFLRKPSKGAESLKLVGFTIGKLSYPYDRGKNIIINLGTRSTQQIFVRATALPIGVYYRMDAVLDRSSPLVWPTQEILLKHPQTRYSKNISVLGFVMNGNKKVYTPVSPTDASDPQLIYLELVSNTVIHKIKWTIGNHADSVVHEYGISPGKKITIKLPRPKTSGHFQIIVRAYNADSKSWVPNTYLPIIL